jgi:hypothetical protein
MFAAPVVVNEVPPPLAFSTPTLLKASPSSRALEVTVPPLETLSVPFPA